MNKLVVLNAFYDAMQYNIGWIISYIFIFLMLIELIYVMAKYLGGDKK
jgi:TRAP-type mannitol/chloroaromatic compound transport system permease small subunit